MFVESVRDAWRESRAGAIVQPGRRSHGCRKDGASVLEFFQRRFNGDPGILGKSVRLNSTNYTVIGVLPDWFRFRIRKSSCGCHGTSESRRNAVSSHYIHIAHVVARLNGTASATAALQEIGAIEYGLYTRLRGPGPMEQGVIAKPLLEDMVGSVKQPLYVLLAAVVCLLLIACLNLSNLLVARSAARRREMAIRSAMGSGRLSLSGSN